jgi:hypothetical protein
MAKEEALVSWFAELQRLGASPGAEIARQRMNLGIDIRHVLPVVRVPTLVVNRVGDLSVDIEEARYIAERIPGAGLAELPGDAHIPWEGDQDPLFAAVERFLATVAEEPPAEERETVLATLVHIAGDGLPAAELAALAGRAGERFRGRIVAAGEDGIDAVFDGPARAIRFADAVVAAAPDSAARAGIQTGELELSERSAAGPPCEAARALAALALPGQIMVSGTVRDLVAGSGIRFEPIAGDQVGEIANVAQALAVERGSLS